MSEQDIKTNIDDVREFETHEPSGHEYIDSLVRGLKMSADANGETWLSYSFPGSDSKFSNEAYYTSLDDVSNLPEDRQYAGTEHLRDMSELPAGHQAEVKAIFAEVSKYTNLKFVEVADEGDGAGTIRMAFTQKPSGTAWAYRPMDNPAGGDVWFNNLDGAKQSVDPEEMYVFKWVARHELGHVFGFKEAVNQEGPYFPTPEEVNGFDYTVMAYDDSARVEGVGPYDLSDLYPQSYMLGDILALQWLYGTNTTATAGDDVYEYSQNARHYLTIWDAGGNDTLKVTDGNTDTVLDLTPNEWSNVGTTITYTSSEGEVLGTQDKTVFNMSTIENAEGASGNDQIIGNDEANSLIGNDGNDTISGGKGSDTLLGGAGNDALWAGKGDESADRMDGGDGADTIGGGAGDDTLSGGDGSDLLFGGAGNDTLAAGKPIDVSSVQLAGKDTIWGGAGDDEIIGAGDADLLGGGDGHDHIMAGSGNDTVFAGKSGDDTLDAGAGDDVIYAGSGSDTVDGGAGDDELYGGAGNDVINTGAGVDTVYGGGGNDTLTGGEGADTFYFAEGHGVDVVKGFDIAEDQIDISSAGLNLLDLLAFQSRVSAETIEGVDGLLVETGEGTSVFLEELSMDDLLQIKVIL